MRSTRTKKGAFLIELLAALVMASLLALALYASIAEYMRLTTITESRELAAIMAQEVLERVRNISYDSPFLPVDATKTYQLRINDFDSLIGLPSNSPSLARPLLLDTTNLQYSTQVADIGSMYHKFKGTVTLTITDGPIYPLNSKAVKDTKTATVEVKWFEPGSSIERSLRSSSILHRYGLNHHGS